MTIINLFLDDDKQYRPTPIGYKRFVTGESLIQYLQSEKPTIGTISFDNDLGQNIMEGYDVAKYMVNHQIEAQRYNIHSANIVAQKNIASYLSSAMNNQIIATAPITQHRAGDL